MCGGDGQAARSPASSRCPLLGRCCHEPLAPCCCASYPQQNAAFFLAPGSLQIADLSFVLTDEEVDNGIFMLCMARPVSDVVRVETQVRWRAAQLGVALACCSAACSL